MPALAIDLRQVTAAFNSPELIRLTGGDHPIVQPDNTLKLTLFLSNGGALIISGLLPTDASQAVVQLYRRDGSTVFETEQPLSVLGQSREGEAPTAAPRQLTELGVFGPLKQGPTKMAAPAPEMPDVGREGEGSGCGGNCSSCGCGGAHSDILDVPHHHSFGCDAEAVLDSTELYLVPLIMGMTPDEAAETSLRRLTSRTVPMLFTSQEAASAFIMGHYLGKDSHLLSDLDPSQADELLRRMLNLMKKSKFGKTLHQPCIQSGEDRHELLAAFLNDYQLPTEAIDEIHEDLISPNIVPLSIRD